MLRTLSFTAVALAALLGCTEAALDGWRTSEDAARAGSTRHRASEETPPDEGGEEEEDVVVGRRVVFPKDRYLFDIDGDRFSAQQLVLKFHEGSRVRLDEAMRLYFDEGALTEEDRVSLALHELTPDDVLHAVEEVNALLLREGDLELLRMLGEEVDQKEVDAERESLEPELREQLADLNLYYYLLWAQPDVDRATTLRDELNGLRAVEIAYAQPIPGDAVDYAPTTTLVLDQDYRDEAPLGVGANYALRWSGGDGEGGRVIDVEVSYLRDHEDLKPPFFFTGWGPHFGSSRDHGTAVMGILGAQRNGYGITGLAYAAELGFSSVVHGSVLFGIPFWNPAGAMDKAARQLSRGQVLLVEQHYMGPEPDFECPGNCSQFGYVAMEYFPAEFDVISRLTKQLGIVVVEAAGNGSVDLDHPVYEGRFDRTVRDSGAILVGGNDATASLGSNGSSNSGSRLDVNAWGQNVATLGYGSGGTINGTDQRQWYANDFGGTSSASAIVAGVAVSLNSVLLPTGKPMLDGFKMRNWLRGTGTRPSSTPNLGVQPDLEAAIQSLIPHHERFIQARKWAHSQGYAHGFPNFRQTGGATSGHSLGVEQLRTSAEAGRRWVNASELGFPRSDDVASMFRAVDGWRHANGHAAAMPTFNLQVIQGVVQHEVITLNPNAIVWKDIPAAQLGNPPFDDWAARFKAVSDWAARNGYAGGFPNFQNRYYNGDTHYGVFLFRQASPAHLVRTYVLANELYQL